MPRAIRPATVFEGYAHAKEILFGYIEVF